jgi:predicted transposase YdaD
MGALPRLAQLVDGAPGHHLAAVAQKRLQQLLEIEQLRPAVHQGHGVDAEHGLQLTVLIEIVEHHVGHLAAAQLGTTAPAGCSGVCRDGSGIGLAGGMADRPIGHPPYALRAVDASRLGSCYPPGMKTDKLFYRLFQAQPELALELVGMPPPYPKGYVHRALEVKETSFRLDGILHPPQGPWPHIFWEAQFREDSSFYSRWLASIFICLHRERILDWRGLVLLPDRSLNVGDPAPYAALLEQGILRRVYLEDLRHTELPSWGVGLIGLIGAPEDQAPGLARDLLARAEDKETGPGLAHSQVLDLLETILVYKLPTLSREEIRSMLHLPDTDLKQTRFYREAFAEGEAEGELKWRREEALALVLRLLARRLGTVSPSHEAMIGALALEQIEALSEELLDFRTENDLASWLMGRSGPAKPS